MKFKEAAELCLKNEVALGSKPKTAEIYGYHLRKHVYPQIGEEDIRGIDRKRIREILANDPGAPRSVALRRAIMSVVFRYAMEELEIIQVNPVQGAARWLAKRKPRAEEPVKVIPKIELVQLCAYLRKQDDPLSRLLFVAAMTGTRNQEAAALKWEDVDFEGGELLVRRTATDPGMGVFDNGAWVSSLKNGKTKRIPIGSPLMALFLKMRGQRGENPYLFVSQKGRPFSRSSVCRGFKEALAACGLPLGATPHWLRHTFHERMRAAGVDIRDCQLILGHENIETTIKYDRQFTRSRTAENAVSNLLN